MTVNIPEVDSLPFVDFAERRALPTSGGVYFALNQESQILYIGRSNNLSQRWETHHRTKQLNEQGCVRLAWLSVDDVLLLPEIEKALIQHFNPPMNSSEVDYPDGRTPIVLRVDKDLIKRLDAALAKRAGPYKPGSRNSVLEVAIREHVEKLEKEAQK